MNKASLLLVLLSSNLAAGGAVLERDGYHVQPGESIQEALDLAARNPTNKVVKVHGGTYRPAAKRQALIYFNQKHDGVHCLAVGEVTLVAANPELTNPRTQGFPSVVNHVVYFGHGVTSNTVLQGFRITGANHFVSEKFTQPMEPDASVPKNLFFYTDGGAIKVFGRSSPTLRNLEIVENYASPCAGGISIQQEGLNQEEVLIENCVFRGNRAEVTGSAIDLLAGSAARIRNCLLVGNASNQGNDVMYHQRPGDINFTNSGVLTIFQKSRAVVEKCTFTGNRNGVDDMGGLSSYKDCIFAEDLLSEGLKGTTRYEVDLPHGGRVSGCVFRGTVLDGMKAVASRDNLLGAPPPGFNDAFVPTAREYLNAGYRPVQTVVRNP